ncbi:MAG: ribbon-helix-helix domain-containing protein [Alphaproteobacteria bacterium]|nr:ribbon-helix-helix domain-containing protein [Alphaproteobacteria bacterium]MCD8570808.1 ribbon-helix-helix domain-containing protein [Alphaproteobacteria bacterium]
MKKRSVNIAGHATSVSLEPEFWTQLEVMADHLNLSINALVTQIDAERSNPNLSSAIRVYILKSLLKQPL